MELQERIEADFIQALKDKNTKKLNVIRGLRAGAKNKEIELGRLLDETELITVIRTEIKKRREAIANYIQGGREDLKQIDEFEISVLDQYVPAQLSDEQIEVRVKEILATLSESDKANFGQVMGRVMKALAGQADGQKVQSMVKKMIQ
ncbi:TPA: glutamyl-tRNA amidotransferase [Candidatus Falkowbacteria bacterium]|nr:glutamyl-tRNA amidotransferase [Candidatus Falkowbacteria bacterium]